MFCFEFFDLLLRYPARWLSGLERRPVTAEVVGSNPIRVVELLKIYFGSYTTANGVAECNSSEFMKQILMEGAGLGCRSDYRVREAVPVI